MVERRTLLVRNLLAAILLSGAPALAQPPFPKIVQDTVGVPCDISQHCTLCHNTNAGGLNNLRNPGFGQSMKDSCGFNGLVPDTLPDALQCAADMKLDTDKDGVPDIDELKAGSDPDGPGMLCGGAASDPPEYGCFARVASRGPVDGVAGAGALATLLLGAALMRRRAR